jgi:hypothetical protein
MSSFHLFISIHFGFSIDTMSMCGIYLALSRTIVHNICISEVPRVRAFIDTTFIGHSPCNIGSTACWKVAAS